MINHDISQDHDISQNHDISRDKSIKKIVINENLSWYVL